MLKKAYLIKNITRDEIICGSDDKKSIYDTYNMLVNNDNISFKYEIIEIDTFMYYN